MHNQMHNQTTRFVFASSKMHSQTHNQVHSQHEKSGISDRSKMAGNPLFKQKPFK
jgi:hypothetical protein